MPTEQDNSSISSQQVDLLKSSDDTQLVNCVISCLQKIINCIKPRAAQFNRTDTNTPFESKTILALDYLTLFKRIYNYTLSYDETSPLEFGKNFSYEGQNYFVGGLMLFDLAIK